MLEPYFLPPLRRLQAALDYLKIRWLIGGSVGASAHGLARATQDIDILAELRPGQAEELARLLGDSFYLDAPDAEGALRMDRSFNILDQEFLLKFDLFPACGPFEQIQLSRRLILDIDLPDGKRIQLPFCTSEDILLAKLRWYRMGGESSERQWRDLTEILARNRERLDRAYLAEWAGRIGVTDLLDRLLALE